VYIFLYFFPRYNRQSGIIYFDRKFGGRVLENSIGIDNYRIGRWIDG
jgi:hypothetical protein